MTSVRILPEAEEELRLAATNYKAMNWTRLPSLASISAPQSRRLSRHYKPQVFSVTALFVIVVP